MDHILEIFNKKGGDGTKTFEKEFLISRQKACALLTNNIDAQMHITFTHGYDSNSEEPAFEMETTIHKVGYSNRTILLESRNIDTEIERYKGKMGQGFGARLTANLAEFMVAAGLEKNQVVTTKIGSYAWPRLGYVVEDGMEEAKAYVSKRAHKLAQSGAMTTQIQRKLDAALDKNSPDFIWDIVDIGETISFKGQNIKAGFFLVNGSSFDAILDVKNEKVMARLRQRTLPFITALEETRLRNLDKQKTLPGVKPQRPAYRDI